MTEATNHFPKNLRVLRKEIGLTQDKISVLIKVPRARYAKWEEGRGTPDLLQLVEISDMFGITVNDMVTKEITLKRALNKIQLN